MERWVLIILCINAGFFVIALIFTAYYLGWLRKIKEWWWLRREPENVITVRMHYEGNLYEEFLTKFEARGFSYKGGKYLFTKDAIQHKKQFVKRNNRRDIIGQLDYVFGYPFPIIFFEKEHLIKQLLETAKEENKIKIVELKRKIRDGEVPTEEEYIMTNSEALYRVDCKALKDIESNTLVTQLLRALANDWKLLLILLLCIVIILGVIFNFALSMGLIKPSEPIQAFCTNIQNLVPKKV